MLILLQQRRQQCPEERGRAGAVGGAVNLAGRGDAILQALEDAGLLHHPLEAAPLVEKGEDAPAQHLEERDPHGPHVPGGALLHVVDRGARAQVVHHAPHVLRGHVPWISEAQPLVLLNKARAAVIGDGHSRCPAVLAAGIDQEVLGLQVVVHAAAAVEEGDTGHGLLEDVGEDLDRRRLPIDVLAEVAELGELADGNGLLRRL
mmetsp:Transcript_134583/g.418249  ORF Transcript_134583/g.418249 Transcript_134583/m.418249 type:complete len:204 (-) Transcript_134583:849-1460(-)